MPAKKKTRSKQRKSKASPAPKGPAKKASKKKLANRTKGQKKLAKKRAAPGSAVTSAKRKKATTVKTAGGIEEQIPHKNRAVYRVGSTRVRRGQVFSGRQSGDLEGISRTQGADSESVDELLEEGNPFEAEVVAGVEEADEADEREVHTHEAPEDDVPDEYLDKD